MFIIPLALLGRQIPTCFLSRLSALHLAPKVSASQLLQSATLSSSSLDVYQHWHFPPSPQDPVLPAGLHLVPSFWASDLAGQCACLQIIFTYVLTYSLDACKIYLLLLCSKLTLVSWFTPRFLLPHIPEQNLWGKGQVFMSFHASNERHKITETNTLV